MTVTGLRPRRPVPLADEAGSRDLGLEQAALVRPAIVPAAASMTGVPVGCTAQVTGLSQVSLIRGPGAAGAHRYALPQVLVRRLVRPADVARSRVYQSVSKAFETVRTRRCSPVVCRCCATCRTRTLTLRTPTRIRCAGNGKRHSCAVLSRAAGHRLPGLGLLLRRRCTPAVLRVRSRCADAGSIGAQVLAQARGPPRLVTPGARRTCTVRRAHWYALLRGVPKGVPVHRDQLATPGPRNRYAVRYTLPGLVMASTASLPSGDR